MNGADIQVYVRPSSNLALIYYTRDFLTGLFCNTTYNNKVNN